MTTYPKLWLFDFDNTLCHLGVEVDWATSRRELEAMLRGEGVAEELFVEFPHGNLLLYDALRARVLEPFQHRAAAPVRGQIDDETARADVARYATNVSVSEQARELIDRACSVIERYEFAGADRAGPLAGAAEVLNALHARSTPVAIVTSNSSRVVARWMRRYGLEATVQAIVGRDSLLPLKPAPAMVTRALDLCDAGPDDTIFVGDSDADLLAALAAGVVFYGVSEDHDQRERLRMAGASRVFATPAVLKDDLGLCGAGLH